jgi:hypothetical protein
MTIDAQREVKKAMMALGLDVTLKKVYGVNLPQGLQHELVQVSRGNFPREEDESILD